MNRRDFFVRATTATLALSAGVFLPRLFGPAAQVVELALPGRRLRGTSDGQVLESLDAGESWQVVAKFGAHCSVHQLTERRGEIVAGILVGGHSFSLRSTDARMWRTA